MRDFPFRRMTWVDALKKTQLAVMDIRINDETLVSLGRSFLKVGLLKETSTTDGSGSSPSHRYSNRVEWSPAYGMPGRELLI